MSAWWYCNACGEQNHETDGECQHCACGGIDCKRDNCSEPEHFHQDHLDEGYNQGNCGLCNPDKEN